MRQRNRHKSGANSAENAVTRAFRTARLEQTLINPACQVAVVCKSPGRNMACWQLNVADAGSLNRTTCVRLVKADTLSKLAKPSKVNYKINKTHL